MTATLGSAAPASYAALVSLIKANAAAQDPPIDVFEAELNQYEPGAYIIVDGIFDDEYAIEATGYEYIESFNIEGYCTVFTGSDGGAIPHQICTQTYGVFTNVVMRAVVDNRGGNGIPVLGVVTYPYPFEIKAHLGNYKGTPANIGGQQAGWQGMLTWSFELRSYVAPA
jgi:hypothetical protein